MPTADTYTRDRNLRQSIVMKPGIETRFYGWGLGSFVFTNISVKV